MEQTNNPVSPTVTPNPAGGTSQDTRTIVTVLLLIFMYPVGFLVMWFWSHWKVWIKLLLSVPAVIITLVDIILLLLL